MIIAGESSQKRHNQDARAAPCHHVTAVQRHALTFSGTRTHSQRSRRGHWFEPSVATTSALINDLATRFPLNTAATSSSPLPTKIISRRLSTTRVAFEEAYAEISRADLREPRNPRACCAAGITRVR